ncbi:hypothetical protein LTR28_009364, partial [Elasticomyces elasticus]
MSDFGDDYTDEPYGFDDDYLYVEDAYAMAVSSSHLCLMSRTWLQPTVCPTFRPSTHDERLAHAHERGRYGVSVNFGLTRSQDDLAEHAIASPPYSPDELEEQFVDYDIYNFWGDLEYGSDEYYDRALAVVAAADTAKSGEKRKRVDHSDQKTPEKRQKLSRSKGVIAV